MVKLNELTEALKIDKFNLDEEMVQQPTLFWRVAELAAIARSRLDEAEADLKVLEAEIDKDLRESLAATGEKYTEASISNTIRRDPRRVNKHKECLDHRLRTEKLDQLRESFRQRSFVLRDLVASHISGYYAQSSATLEDAKTIRAQYNTERMAERRRVR